MTGHWKEVCLPKKRRVKRGYQDQAQPSWHYTWGHIVDFGLGGHGAQPSWELFLGLIHQLSHNTHCIQFIGWPTIQGKLAGSIHLVGLADPQYQFLKKIEVAGPPFMGSTYLSAHQQAPPTKACLYGWGTQCWWVIPTNCPGHKPCNHVFHTPLISCYHRKALGYSLTYIRKK